MGIRQTIDTAFQTGFVREARIALLVTAAVVAVSPALPDVVRYAPFVLSILVLGLPHGAVDHLVPYKLTDVSLKLSVGTVVFVYALVGLAYLGVWLVSPLAGIISFIGMTLLHWGQGDVYTGTLYDEGTPSTLKWLRLYVHGAFPMVLPLATFPEAYLQVVDYMHYVVVGSPTALTVTLRIRVAAVAAVLIPAVILLMTLWFTDGEVVEEAAEIGVLTLFFSLVPPVFAIGVYFCFWHGARHLSRLTRASSSTVWNVFREAIPMTVGAIVLVTGLYVWFGVSGLGEGLGVYLIGIAVMTAPHVLLVTLMDIEERVWA